jgi:hypothetical protein
VTDPTYQQGTDIVPTPTGVDLVAQSPVPDADPLAEFKDDRKYRAKYLTPRAALRRAQQRLSKLDNESQGLAPGVAQVLKEWDEAYGAGNRRIVDDLACMLEAMLRRGDISAKDFREIWREITDQTDGPPTQSMNHEVNLLSIKQIEVPEGTAERL